MVSVACGATHTVALTVKGGVMAWGGGSNNTPKPVNVGQKAYYVGCSDSATLLLTQTGNLIVCQDPSQLPHFQVLADSRGGKQGKEVVGAAVGVDHTVAVTHEGRILMWNAYPPHSPQGAQQTPIEVEVPRGGKHKALFVACGAAHTVAIVSHSRGLGDSAIREHGSLNGFNSLNGINGTTNGNGLDSTMESEPIDDLFSDSTTQQTIARLRSKLASTPTRARSPLRSPTPTATPTSTQNIPTSAGTQSSLYSHQSSLALLSSRISALGSFNQSRKLEDSLTSSLNTNGMSSGLKRQQVSSLTSPSGPSFSWRSSANSRRHSDLDADDVGLHPKQTRQSSLFPQDDTPSSDEAEPASRFKQGFRGIYDHLRGNCINFVYFL